MKNLIIPSTPRSPHRDSIQNLKILPSYLEIISLSRKNLFAVSTASAGFDITDSEIVRQADIIHIHWINQGFLSLK